MELYFDLFEKGKKKKLFIIIGIFWTIIAMAMLGANLHTKTDLFIFNITISIVNILLGIYYTLKGFGYPFESFFYKKFILINSNFIQTRNSLYKKTKTFYWKDLQNLRFGTNTIYYNSNSVLLNFSDLTYLEVKEIKDFILNLSTEKGINNIK